MACPKGASFFHPQPTCASLVPLFRAFSTTRSSLAKSSVSRLEHLHRDVPEYPYGPSQWYKQSNFGLYGGSHIQFGNTISEKFENKSRRKWRPNIRTIRLYSAALGRKIRVKLSARVLRTTDKVGGLDEYLLGEKPARIKELGMGGWLLRWRIMQTPSVRARFAEQRVKLGLPPKGPTDMEGKEVEEATVQAQIAEYDQGLDESERIGAEEDAEEALRDPLRGEDPVRDTRQVL
ncbi:MAG: 39S ribosomal protein L24, mitochondrial [Caeruleum heppii]|nr:MAG: 39S ribosomal protein L24, mitochondrial [Caeruleum heppii]